MRRFYTVRRNPESMAEERVPVAKPEPGTICFVEDTENHDAFFSVNRWGALQGHPMTHEEVMDILS